MQYTVNYANQKDLNSLSKVFLEVLLPIPYYNELAKSNEEKKYTYKELLVKHKDDFKSIILVKEKEEIAGFCFSRFDDFTIWLECFRIATPYRGNNLTDLLLKKLEVSAKERKCHKIWCDSRTENQKSINILKKNGYENIALVKNHWYSQDFFLWQKFLKNEDAL